MTARHEGDRPRALEADDALRGLEPALARRLLGLGGFYRRRDNGEVELCHGLRGRLPRAPTGAHERMLVGSPPLEGQKMQ